MKMKFIILGAISILLSACVTHRVGDFTVLSTKNINLNSNSLSTGPRVKGEDSSASIAHMKNAVDAAIQTDRCGVALSDAVINLKQGPFHVSYIVEGNIVYDKSISGCSTK
ncbi:hypothetical protein [Mannheimia indoligenes]|uniref:hypothetical protein n=1 Tax=Mannheimia indoligenes TaxID=3103145 RepID=UPI002FE54382